MLKFWILSLVCIVSATASNYTYISSVSLSKSSQGEGRSYEYAQMSSLIEYQMYQFSF